MLPAAFVLMEAFPLTPNGKIDRRALPDPDRERPRLEADYVEPATPVEKCLAEIWSRILGVEKIGVHDNFFELGGDSILSIQIIAQARNAGLQLTPKQLFQHQTIAALAGAVGSAPTIQAEQGPVTGQAPLTPIQHWFFEQQLAEPHHFNQAILLGVPHGLNLRLLELAVQNLVAHHDALRLRFEQQGQSWQQTFAGAEDAALFLALDLSALPEAKRKETIEARAAAMQASLNLSTGPLLRVALFDCGPQTPARLLLVVHHLAVDSVSWRILLEDLWTTYGQLGRGDPLRLPPKTSSFRAWAERLARHAQSPAVQAELAYWLALADAHIPRLPVDDAGGSNTEAAVETVMVSLEDEETRLLLQEVPRVYHTQINDVLLTALAQACERWRGEPALFVDLEGHGREDLFDDVDLSRTVGWFTTIFPALLDTGAAKQPKEALLRVKEQLRRIPNRGIGYGLLRYLDRDTGEAGKLDRLPRPEVSFNYLGQFGPPAGEDSPASAVEESSGPMRGMRNRRSHLLEIDGGVAGGRLRFDWRYSREIHRRATIEALAQDFLRALSTLIAHCLSAEAGGYTPSDFPKARVSQKDLDKLMTKMKKS
jgi:non-ribosomal peptide synthase protein (TIGR01720 family)